MKKSGFFLLLWLPVVAFGQDRKKVTNKLEGGFYRKETYQVLKQDRAVKDGSYARYFRRGLAEKGQYANNEKTGVWEYYGLRGEVVQRYNFTERKLDFSKPTGFDDRTRVLKDGKVSDEKPDEMPVPLGGEAVIFLHMGNTIRYPAEALRNMAEGKVLIAVTVTADGKLIDETVQKGPGYGLDEESLRVIRLLPDGWIPGKVKGVPVDTRVVLASQYTIR